jgi:hypothetical protein
MSSEQDICAICLDSMNVCSYKDVEETVIEGNCTRLACGHAMHTCCLVESLIRTEGKCVQCNRRNIDHYKDDLTWEERLSFEKVCIDKLKQIKKSEEVKTRIKEYFNINKEIKLRHSEFKKKVEAYKSELRKEMEIDGLIKSLKSSKRQAMTAFNKAVRSSKGVESIALSNLTTFTLNKWLFRETWNTHRRFIVRGYSNGFY